RRSLRDRAPRSLRRATGVAVAVALVPPLACVGVLIGRGQPDLANGAELLFATNLFGIILAAAVVFITTGFVPADHFHNGRRRILTTLVVTAAPTLAVAAVLTTRFLDTVDHARQLRLATQVTVAWLGGDADLNRMSLSGTTVQVNITGKKAPPPLRILTDNLSTTLGHATTVDVRWTPVHDDTPPPAPPPLDKIYPLVQQWLSGQSLTLDGLTYNSASLAVAASGDHPPRNADQLRALIEQTYATAPPISLAWTYSAPKTTGTYRRRLGGDRPDNPRHLDRRPPRHHSPDHRPNRHHRHRHPHRARKTQHRGSPVSAACGSAPDDHHYPVDPQQHHQPVHPRTYPSTTTHTYPGTGTGTGTLSSSAEGALKETTSRRPAPCSVRGARSGRPVPGRHRRALVRRRRGAPAPHGCSPWRVFSFVATISRTGWCRCG
ncbi:MAG: DUF389 domain-containing protein, partial [Pseudonocardiales bacterium]|nr:DUF389 domain-containing protein [Pseudonocardiales bacterium]